MGLELPPGSGSSGISSIAAIITGNPPTFSSNAAIVFPTVVQDTNSAYNASTGQYTAPVTGFYQVSAAISCTAVNPVLSAYVNGTIVAPSMGASTTAVSAPTGSITVYATSGQTIDVRLNAASGLIQTTLNNGLTITLV